MGYIETPPLMYKDEDKKIGLWYIPDAETKARLEGCGELGGKRVADKLRVNLC